MPKVFTSKTQKVGEIGENIAERFLVKHGYTVNERNYTKKWGEIDIIAKKEGKIYFIEVKSKQVESINVSYETNRPEENMHPRKIQRMSRVIQTYLLSKKISEEVIWQVDLLVVYLDLTNKRSKIKVVANIVL
jgi:putative endonuclease